MADNGTAATFCESLPWTLEPDVLWQGRTGTYQLDDDRRVVLTLSTRGHSEHYVGFKAEVVSKTNGPIVEKFFGFWEHLDLADSIDCRTGRRPASKESFQVISYVRWDWHVISPTQPETFTGAVEAWIATWR